MELSFDELSYIVWMYSNCDEFMSYCIKERGDKEEEKSFEELKKVMRKICKECFGIEE